ncbi:MAG: Stp1/IreP family PP2C-type Ser/Thr phosphatase [Candidatus Acidiferrales bacterium]
MSDNGSLHIEVGSNTDVGLVRANNEDSYCLVPELNLFVVSDGMGGETHGELASAMTVETISAHCLEASSNASTSFFAEFRPNLSERSNRLVSAVHLANRRIFDFAVSNPDLRGMGSTVLAAWIEGSRLSLVHVGDSRAYLFRSGALEHLTTDHSLVAEQVRTGTLTPEQADSSILQSVLLRALGTREQVEVDANEFMLISEDVLLLCTDGLTRMVPDPAIASTVLNSPRPQDAADRLVEQAKQRGGEDNVTVIVLRITERR